MNGILDYCSIGIFLVIAVFSIIGGIKVVPEYQRLVVFRLGRPLDNPKGPGLTFLIPVIDRAAAVDLREQKREVFNQEAITKDFIPVSYDFRWYYKVLDPIKAVIAVGNPELVMAGVISTKLRNEIQEVNSTNLPPELTRLSSEIIRNNQQFREVSEQIGIIITHFEILKLAIDDHKKELDDAKSTIGTLGETQTTVHTSGTVSVGEKTWDAISSLPIAPKTKVRIKRIILEVEESR